jgi:hypothetical protein
MRPLDTTEEAERVRVECLRRMTGTQRADVARRWSRLIVEAFKSGIRARHPDYTDEDVHIAAARHLWGDELFRSACPGERLLDI